jgi:dipeptidase D
MKSNTTGFAATGAAGCAVLVVGCAVPLVSNQARDVARYAVDTYYDSTVATLGDFVTFRTVQEPGVQVAEHPAVREMTVYLERKAGELGLDFEDHGAVVVLGLGNASDRLGVVTHADVQPADASKWARDPFSLDRESEPGRLVGRGVEDDKGPIATAIWAMKALKDREVALARRIELIISYSEESDWAPFQRFLARNEPPSLNVVIDAEYPVVTGEKGWNAIFLSVPADEVPSAAGDLDQARLTSFSGGSFLSQVPEDGVAVIEGADPVLTSALRAAAASDTAVEFSFLEGEPAAGALTVRARGTSAHSSKPWEGTNGITHLAALLATYDWPAGQVATMVRLVNDLVGTGDYAERFGDLAFSHEFMGRLTLSLTTLGREEDGSLRAGINVRAPMGRSRAEMESVVAAAVQAWKAETGIETVEHSTITSDPHYLEDAPHIPTLLAIFRHYTGREDAAPTSMGGGTHARLVPNGVNFGPAMPDEPYTGHSEHEYMSEAQYRLNLEMYTAMLVELAGG